MPSARHSDLSGRSYISVRGETMKPSHHTFLQTVGNLYRKDRCAEWWTITDEALFYEYRHTIPFRTLYCHTGKGGLVVYLDHPEIPQ